MNVIYRIADKGYKKDKPEYINNKNCLKNASDIFSDNCDWHVMADNISKETEQMILCYQSKLNHVSVGHGAGTFNLALDKALSFNDDDVVYFLETGVVSVSSGSEHIANLESGDVLGEIAMVTGAPRTATATAKEDTLVLALPKDDFDHLRKESPKFEIAAQTLAASRLQELVDRDDVESDAKHWANQAIAGLSEETVIPSDAQLQEASEEHGAPMAIWLGILLDGIPESFVIGSALVVSITATIAQSGADSVTFATIVPYTLIAGLFLANFPEAMSSSIGMQKQGWGRSRVFFMWFSLMVMTSIGAGFGFWLGGSVGHGVVVLIEGLAAGAMLTMIAAAMIPEAVHLGGSTVTGLGTLGGFLSAVAFKLLE